MPYNYVTLTLSLLATALLAEESPYKCECILGNPVRVIDNMNSYVPAFVPYNPVIIEVGAYQGKGTQDLAQTFPYGQIFAFEPNPTAYNVLVEKTQFLKNVTTIPLAINTFCGTAYLWGDTPNNLSRFKRSLPGKFLKSEKKNETSKVIELLFNVNDPGKSGQCRVESSVLAFRSNECFRCVE